MITAILSMRVNVSNTLNTSGVVRLDECNSASHFKMPADLIAWSILYLSSLALLPNKASPKAIAGYLLHRIVLSEDLYYTSHTQNEQKG